MRTDYQRSGNRKSTLDVKIKVEVAKKKKEIKDKEDKDLKEELNKEFPRHIRRDKKHYYNSKYENKKPRNKKTHGKIRVVFQKIS